MLHLNRLRVQSLILLKHAHLVDMVFVLENKLTHSLRCHNSFNVKILEQHCWSRRVSRLKMHLELLERHVVEAVVNEKLLEVINIV